MERLHPEDLQDTSKFVLSQELDHDNLVPVINGYLRQSSPIRNAYIFANIVVFALCAWLLSTSGRSFVDGVSNLCLGMVLGFLLLLPVHENLHALAYRYYGGKQVKVFYKWRNLTAFCVADNFVVNGRQLMWVGLMPFLVINPLLLLLLTGVGGPLRLFLAGMLLLHVGACSGDFGMVNLVWAHRSKGLWTYDNSAIKRSFFYRAANPIE